MVSLRATRASIRGRGTAVPVRIRPARRSINPNGSNGDTRLAEGAGADPEISLCFVLISATSVR